MTKQVKTQNKEEADVTNKVKDRVVILSVVKMVEGTFSPERGKELEFPLAFLECVHVG